MVSPDPSSFESSAETQPRVAPVFDRLLAFFIDFLIFMPVVSLVGAGVLRDVRVTMIVDAGSAAASILWLSLIAGSVVFCILAESLCLYRWGGTPGQIFLQLDVKPWPVREKLTLLQCLARTTLWWVSLPLILPLLGVYTNRYRRAFHDRATDTLVVTRKVEGDPGPLEFEVRFFRSWSQMFVLFALFVAAGTLVELHRMTRAGAFASNDEESPLCEEVDPSLAGPARVDHAVAGYLAGRWEESCLEREAEYAIWSGEDADRPLANVAMGIALAGDGETAKAYLSRACELEAKGEACGIAMFLQSEKNDRGDWLRRAGLSTVTSRLLLVRESIDRGQVPSAVSLIKDLRDVKEIGTWLQRQEVRAFWKLKDQVRGRRPASDESRRLLEEFEARYDLR